MAKIADTNIWVYSVDEGTDAPTSIIFHNNSGTQTDNLTYTAGYMYKLENSTIYKWSPVNNIYLKGSFADSNWGTKYKFELLKANSTDGAVYQITDFTPGSGNYKAGSSSNGLKVHVAAINNAEINWYSNSTYKFTDTATSATLSTDNNNSGFYLPNTYTVTYNATTNKLTFTKTETTKLTAIYLYDGTTKTPFTEGSSTWTLDDFEVATGSDNANYTIIAEYTTTYTDGSDDKTIETIYTTSSSAIASKTAYPLSQGSTGFYFDFTVGKIDASVTVTNDVPTSVTFTEQIEETGRILTGLALHKSGGSDTGTFSKVSDTEWTLGQTRIEVGKKNAYYLKAIYTIYWNNNTTTSETVFYNIAAESTSIEGAETALNSKTNYTLYERTDDYFYFNYENYLTTTGTVTVTEGVPTAVTFTEVESEFVVEPNDPTITLCKSDGTIVGTFAKTSDDTYELSKTTITIASGSYKIGFQASESDAVTYYSVDGSGYWIGQKTYDIVNTSFTFTFGSSNADSAPVFTSTSVIGIVTLSNDVPATMYFTEPLADGVNLPLTAADFANGKKHYFLVGTRTGDWHLQPEWELQEDANGNFVINNSLLYTGYYAIAVVDNYFNYAKNRYTAYATEYAVKSGYTSGISLSKQSYTGPSAYGSQADTFTSTNCLAFVYYTYAKTSSSVVVDNMTILQSLPTFVESIEVSVSTDGTPSEVSFNGCSLDQTKINNELVFSLVGNLTTYQNDDYDVNPVEIASKTQRATNVKDNLADWQEGWIQFDEKGDPYVDGNGNYLYHTRFQREYLLNHPTSFKYNGEDGGTKFPFMSDNILFVYNEELSKDESRNTTIGDDDDETYYAGMSETSGQSRSVTSGSTYSCFVVEDMWVDGQFKVWTGWGGVTKQGDANMGNGDKNAARWYYENGGHSVEGKAWTISPNVYYGTERDKSGANFTVDKRRFFKRVEMWYDPSAGFTNSIIHLVVENGGPNIYALQTGRNAIDYSWNIPDEEEQAQNYDVKEIRIYRMVLDAAGNPTSTTLIETVGSWAEGEKKASEFKEITTVNDPGLNFGTYQYSIEVDYYEGGTGESEGLSDDGTYFTREAKSNKITLRAPVMPDECEAIQLVYSDAAGETEATDADTEKYYSFDVRVSANAPEEYIGVKRTTDGATDKDVYTLVKYYVITLPTVSNYDFCTSIEVENGTKYVELTKDILASTYGLTTEDLAAFTDGATLIGVEPISGEYYRMPDVVFKNVIPDNYTFYVNMVNQEDCRDEWALYNVATASATVKMEKPSVKYEASAFEIAKCSPDATATMDDTYKVLGSHRMNMTYSNSNKISTTNGKFTPLMVTNGVLNDWNVKYTVEATMVNPGTTGTTSYDYTLAGINKKALNAGVDANFDYLPINYGVGEALSSDIDVIKDVKSRTAKESTITTETTVAYSRIEGNTDYKSSETETGSIEMDPSKETFVNGSALARYELTENYNYLVQGSYNFEEEVYGSTYGTTTYFTNAIASFQWTANEDLHNAAGFHSVSSHSDCSVSTLQNGYTVIKDSGIGYERVAFPAEGGDVLRDSSYPDIYYLNYSDEENVAEAVAAAGKLPIKVWHVGDGKNAPATTLYTALTADYPVLIYPTLTATLDALNVDEVSVASVEDGVFSSNVTTEYMISLSYPQLLSKDLSKTTTGITDIAADVAGDFRIWPNPAVDVVNVAASAALGTIEIYAVDGRLVKTVEVDDTHAALEVSDLMKGTYIVRAAGATQRMIKK